METRTFYNQILTEHNLRPGNKRPVKGANLRLEGVNPSCGDDIWLELRVENGKIVDGGYQGSGCAVSQASADMMLDLVIGQPVSEARRLAGLFQKMIRGEATQKDLEELDEAASLQDVSHMPARVKCAVLGWRTLDELLKDQ